MTSADIASPARAGAATLVLLTLASGQFLMTLDSSVMNVSIATVAGVAFVSDADLEAALDEAGARSATTDAALDAYGEARLAGLRSALAILAVLAIVALFLAQGIPTRPPGAAEGR